MPYLNEEVKEWIALELQSLGVEDLAVYALEAGTGGDERRVMVATEVGLLDHRYAPFGSSARYRLAMLMYPWQASAASSLRADTFRLWAREHRTRWSFRLHHPRFEAATRVAGPSARRSATSLGCCAVMRRAVRASRPAGSRPTALARSRRQARARSRRRRRPESDGEASRTESRRATRGQAGRGDRRGSGKG